MKDLNVLHNDNSSYIDLSNDLEDYLRDDTALTFVALEDELLIGLYKPFDSVYIELTTAATATNLTFEYSTAASFNALIVKDDTKNLIRNGFVSWDRTQTDWELQTIDGKELYWVKITADADFTATLRGLNILFNDDNSLLAESSRINRYLPKNETSFVKFHVAARNEIVQTLRNGGSFKYEGDASFTLNPMRNITKWDILDIGEISEAAKFLTLAKIYFENSVNIDDKEYQKYNDNYEFFGNAFKLFFMSIDKDDDGVIDEQTERLELNDVTIEKI